MFNIMKNGCKFLCVDYYYYICENKQLRLHSILFHQVFQVPATNHCQELHSVVIALELLMFLLQTLPKETS